MHQQSRFSVLSSSSEHLSPTSTSSPRFSLSSAPSLSTALHKPANRPNIYDRSLNKTRTAEISAPAFAFLLSEMVQYTQKRVGGINDLERRLNTLGYRVGVRVLELVVWRAESSSKTPKREIRFLPALMSIHTQVWRAVFGRPADAVEKSVENEDEYMIIDNDPLLERHISVPKDLSTLSCSSFTAGIVEAVLDGLGFGDRSQHTHSTISISHHHIDQAGAVSVGARASTQVTTVMTWVSPHVLATMVAIHNIDITPPLINTSCVWASDESQLAALFDCPYTGAVTTRTATLGGFDEDASHTVAFFRDSPSSLNSYGYSPHPISSYVGPGGWVRTILKRTPDSAKPFIVSITESHAANLRLMLDAIQDLRAAQQGWADRIAIELNTSCPNIPARPPPSYDPTGPGLAALLDMLAERFWEDKSLAIGIKLPPYVVATQITDVVRVIAKYSRIDLASGVSMNPFAFLTCTNTLGNSLVFADQVEGGAGGFAVPPGVGGLAGEAIHALSLGNVYTVSRLLKESEDPALQNIVIIGAGGVTCPAAVARMHRAGAKVVGSATLLGKLGVAAFEQLAPVIKR